MKTATSTASNNKNLTNTIARMEGLITKNSFRSYIMHNYRHLFCPECGSFEPKSDNDDSKDLVWVCDDCGHQWSDEKYGAK